VQISDPSANASAAVVTSSVVVHGGAGGGDGASQAAADPAAQQATPASPTAVPQPVGAPPAVQATPMAQAAPVVQAAPMMQAAPTAMAMPQPAAAPAMIMPGTTSTSSVTVTLPGGPGYNKANGAMAGSDVIKLKTACCCQVCGLFCEVRGKLGNIGLPTERVYVVGVR
jgi:hypothetical protein